jgi:nitrate/nitrite-specific signal transduction histidine kinase
VVTVNGRDEFATLANVFNQMTAELRDLIGSLEQRVAERTERLEVIATLGERLNAILDLEGLLVEVVNQLKERFGYHYAYIYLFDDASPASGTEQEKVLVLAAGSGEAGQLLKARGHHLPITHPTNLVAQAARTGQMTQFTPEAETAAGANGPQLPLYDELDVPITLGAEEQVLGVLGVQQNWAGSLDESDANLLRSLANRVAVAI